MLPYNKIAHIFIAVEKDKNADAQLQTINLMAMPSKHQWRNWNSGTEQKQVAKGGEANKVLKNAPLLHLTENSLQHIISRMGKNNYLRLYHFISRKDRTLLHEAPGKIYSLTYGQM